MPLFIEKPTVFFCLSRLSFSVAGATLDLWSAIKAPPSHSHHFLCLLQLLLNLVKEKNITDKETYIHIYMEGHTLYMCTFTYTLKVLLTVALPIYIFFNMQHRSFFKCNNFSAFKALVVID